MTKLFIPSTMALLMLIDYCRHETFRFLVQANDEQNLESSESEISTVVQPIDNESGHTEQYNRKQMFALIGFIAFPVCLFFSFASTFISVGKENFNSKKTTKENSSFPEKPEEQEAVKESTTEQIN